jgi:hypothetical protein
MTATSPQFEETTKMAKITSLTLEQVKKYAYFIPQGMDLVIFEKGTDPEETSLLLMGFHEVDLFVSEFKNPRFTFV